MNVVELFHRTYLVCKYATIVNGSLQKQTSHLKSLMSSVLSSYLWFYTSVYCSELTKQCVEYKKCFHMESMSEAACVYNM